MAAINRARATLNNSHHANTTATSNPQPTGSTPYMTSHSAGSSQQGVLAVIRGLSKKQDSLASQTLATARKDLV